MVTLNKALAILNFRYTPGKCEGANTQSSCLNSKPGMKCIWDRENQKCISLTSVPKKFLDDKVDQRDGTPIYV